MNFKSKNKQRGYKLYYFSVYYDLCNEDRLNKYYYNIEYIKEGIRCAKMKDKFEKEELKDGLVLNETHKDTFNRIQDKFLQEYSIKNLPNEKISTTQNLIKGNLIKNAK